MTELSLRNLKKVYPQKKAAYHLFQRSVQPETRPDEIALQQFSLEIEKGEFIVLLGESGCGKTTLLRMIAGLEDVTEGEIWMDGENITDVYPEDRNMAMVFQNYALYAHLTVFDNIAFPLRAQHVPRADVETQVNRIAELLELTDVLDRKPAELSGGQQQRTAIGRAVIRHPAIFLMDEPFSNLDAALRRKLRMYVKKLHEELGTTFLYVTHDQQEAMTLGNRIVLMRRGRIQQIGTPQELYLNPQNQYVASFIGQPQMNFADVKLNWDNDGWYLHAYGQELRLQGKKCAKFLPEWRSGHNVTLGVRPVHLCLSQSGFPAEVEYAEPIGMEVHLHLKAKTDKLCMVVAEAPSPFFRGQQMTIMVQPRYLYLFDPKDGQRIY